MKTIHLIATLAALSLAPQLSAQSPDESPCWEPDQTLAEAFASLEICTPAWAARNCPPGFAPNPAIWNACKAPLETEFNELLESAQDDIAAAYSQFLNDRFNYQRGYDLCVSQGQPDCSQYEAQLCADKTALAALIDVEAQALCLAGMDYEAQFQECLDRMLIDCVPLVAHCGVTILPTPPPVQPPPPPVVICPRTGNPPPQTCLDPLITTYTNNTMLIAATFNSAAQVADDEYKLAVALAGLEYEVCILWNPPGECCVAYAEAVDAAAAARSEAIAQAYIDYIVLINTEQLNFQLAAIDCCD